MRFLLIAAAQEEITMSVRPLGPALVASAVERAGHEVRLLDLMGKKNSADRMVTAELEDFSPEVIGVSVRNIDDQNRRAPVFLLEDALRVVKLCRERSSAPIILGGAGYSMFPKSILELFQAEYGILGEGEEILPELLGRLKTGGDPAGLPGVFVRQRPLGRPRSFCRRLDDLAWEGAVPWLGPVLENEESWVPVQTRRGCPLGCVYCSTGAIEGRTIRKMSPDRAVDFLKALNGAGYRHFFFTDNTFNLPLSFSKELCARMIDRGVSARWRCIVYPGRVDEELVRLMAESGCAEVSLGFETGSQTMLYHLNKRFTPDDVRRTRNLLGERGIRTTGFLMFGAPGETRTTVLESLDFVTGLNPDFLKITEGVRIYPDTRLAETARRQGRLGPEDDLLHPRFFMEPDLEEWLEETVTQWMNDFPERTIFR